MPIEKKWWVLCNESQLSKLGPAMNQRKPSGKGPVAGSKSGTTPVSKDEKGTPGWYISKFMKPEMREVTPKLVNHLVVSLRTMPLRCGSSLLCMHICINTNLSM
jgi:hypothetical protein